MYSGPLKYRKRAWSLRERNGASTGKKRGLYRTEKGPLQETKGGSTGHKRGLNRRERDSHRRDGNGGRSLLLKGPSAL